MLAAILMGSVVSALPIYAEDGDDVLLGDNLSESAASKAGEIVSKAIELLFADDKGAVSVKSVFSNIFKDIGYVNSAVTLR